MIICGLKLTHDAAVSLIDNGKLIFCYEIEKINNNERYATFNDFSYDSIADLLEEYGYKFQDIDQLVIDGWGEFSNKTSLDLDYPVFKAVMKSKMKPEGQIELARYGMHITNEDLLQKTSFNYKEMDLQYTSYLHVSGHVMSAYCTSSFARRKEDSFILVWDGGMCPQLFYMNAKLKKIENHGNLFYLLGSIYSSFASIYEPFNYKKYDINSVAGKVMAYIAKGTCNTIALTECKRIFTEMEDQFIAKANFGPQAISQITADLLCEFSSYGQSEDIESVDMMATFHVFLQDILVERLSQAMDRLPNHEKNLCFVGGCALNIKWNSAIRNTEKFKEMWVPPFPNDSGSAVGAACCEMVTATGNFVLDWDVYSGPSIINGSIDHTHWGNTICSLKELAKIMHDTNEPVVFLNGRAELGPRALGNRSILAAPVTPEMKIILNKAKKRENYRPVAPLCIEEDAPIMFIPGSPDPLMLYDHIVKEEWKDKIPAICHLDGSARLQTVNNNENPVVYELLGEYKKLSGVSLLCNTSANFNGKGFFPDVNSAMTWGEIPLIWSAGKLFIKKQTAIYDKIMKGKKELV